jgi:hypothetical protein
LLGVRGIWTVGRTGASAERLGSEADEIMSRLWLLLLPALSPVLLVVGCYLYHVLHYAIGPSYSPKIFFERLRWASEGFFHPRNSEGLLTYCTLAFLVASILALVLHLFLPRR